MKVILNKYKPVHLYCVHYKYRGAHLNKRNYPDHKCYSNVGFNGQTVCVGNKQGPLDLSLKSCSLYKYLISVPKHSPFIFLDYNSRTNEYQLNGGIDVRVFDTIAKLWNFTYRVVYCHEVWAQHLPNNTWLGVVGKLQRNVLL